MIKFGLIAGTIIVLVPYIGGLIMGTDPSTYKMGEIIGYSTMILSLLTIFIAVKELKQAQGPDSVSFKQVFGLGLGISFIAALMFGLYNVAYVTYIEPEFMDNYFNYYIETVRQSGLPESEVNQQIAKLEQDKEIFMNPWVNFFAMFTSVFMVGFVISLVAGLTQRKTA